MSSARRAGPRVGLTRRLVVFGKLPEPGRTKTRLSPVLGPHGAAELYHAFLDDTMDLAARVRADERELWIPRRPGAESLAARYPWARLRWQGPGDLGERLRRAFGAAFQEGADYVLALGSDHPTLPADYLERGFSALKGAHLVLGPSVDGGYYAVALRRYAWPRAAGLFRDIPWSTPRVLERTRERARADGLCHVELPTWYDVDEPAALRLLRRDVTPESRTSQALARHLPPD